MKLIASNKILILFGVFFLSNILFAQNKKTIAEANKLYDNYAYVSAIKIYEKMADKNQLNQEILQNLGNAYFFRADYTSALKWYEVLFEKINSGEYKEVQPEYYYRYALCLKSAEEYDESNRVMEQFADLVGKNERRVQLFKDNRDYLAEIEKNSGRVDVFPTEVNTEFSEYAPSFFLDNIIFTANRKPGMFGKVSSWTNEGMYNIFISEKEGGSISNEKKVNSGINTSLNESTTAFTKDGKVVYFTRNDISNKKKGDKTILLKIYRAEGNSNGDWVNVKELPFCSSEYNTAHPTLSPDEKFLYFASNMPGTYGKSDIFRVEIKEDGTYGEPENLGKTINTAGRETFPFITSENVLYFASDGYPGLGGLDIYASQIEKDNKLGASQNVGRPINSPYDDFTLILDDEKSEGYFASNRPGGKGSDDIYFFKQRIPLNLKCTKSIKGIVKDASTGKVLEGAIVDLRDRLFNEKSSITTTQKGEFGFEQGLVFCDDEYSYLRASKEGYLTKEDKVVLSEKGDVITHEFLLEPEKQKISKGDDLAKVFNIKEIYFDFDKSDIRPRAEVQLSQIVEVMKEYPNMIVEVKSHTDSRGSKPYNKRLSDRRAKSTIKWIVSQGISSDRIYGEGYGESMLLNGCSDGVKCSEEEHAINRRSEFIVIKI